MTPEQKKSLEDATGALAVAQTEVDAALQDIQSGAARAEKSIISQRLSVAFEKLAEARSKLEGILGPKK